MVSFICQRRQLWLEPLHKMLRLRHPATHIDRAAEDDGIVAVNARYAACIAQVNDQPGRAQLLNDAVGDLASAPVLARLCYQYLHGRLLSQRVRGPVLVDRASLFNLWRLWCGSGVRPASFRDGFGVALEEGSDLPGGAEGRDQPAVESEVTRHLPGQDQEDRQSEQDRVG